MKAKIVKQWYLEEHQLWLYENDMRGNTILYKPGPNGHLIGTTFERGTQLPEDGCFWLPPDALKAIADAAAGEYPPSEATVTHLKDAIVVRDRLLAIVEKGKP